MKKFGIMMFVAMLLIVFCGAPPEGPESETPTTPKSTKEIAYATLSEGEIQKFIKVLPTAKKAIEESGKKFEAEDADNWEAWLGQFANVNKEITGLDAKMKAAGMPWHEFWAAFSKVWMAAVAVMIEKEGSDIDEGIKEMKAQIDNPKVPEAQKEMMRNALKGVEQMKEIYDKVPQVNKDLVEKHWAKLSELLEIEE